MNASSSVRRNPVIGCASSRSSLAAERIGNHSDLLSQILVCLPVTSLIRFKSVARHWLSLISDSRFTARYNARNPRPSASGFFVRRNGWSTKSTYVSLQGHSNPPPLASLDSVVGDVKCLPTIMDSSYGLLLWQYAYLTSSAALTSYIVCNPTTRSYKLLPSRPLPCMCRAFLAFDPLQSPHHKVVVMGGYPSVQIEIYFSESSSWEKFLLPSRRALIRHEALCGSVIYWISEGNVIVGFDIDSKKMLDLPNPPRIDRVEDVKYFEECGGSLTLIESDTPSAMVFRILEMDKDYWRWIVKFQVNLGPLLSEFLELESTKHNYSILFVLEGEKEKDYRLVLATRTKVISYNLRSETWNVLQDDPFSHIHPYETCPFVPSLFPI